MRYAANFKLKEDVAGRQGASKEFVRMIASALRRGALALGLVCVMVPVDGGAETSALELQLTREAWAIDREAFEQQLQSAQTQIRALNEKLSAQEKNLQSDMASQVESLDAQLTKVSKERNQVYLENEKLKQELSQSKEALAAVEAMGANRQQDAKQSSKQAMQIKALSARLTKLVEVSKVRLQEIATLRAENEKLRQESDALRLALAQTEADKDAVLAQLQDRLLKLQARVEQLNQLAGISTAPTTNDERVSSVAPVVNATAQTAPAAATVVTSAEPKIGRPTPAPISVAEPPSFVDWALAKAVQNKLYVLLTLGVLLLLLGGAFWFLRRKVGAQEMPLPDLAELPSPEMHAETYFDPTNRAPSNDEGQILDEAVDSLVSKIRATSDDQDFSVTAEFVDTDAAATPLADDEAVDTVEDTGIQVELSSEFDTELPEDDRLEPYEVSDSEGEVSSNDEQSEQILISDENVDDVIVPLEEHESVEVVQADPVRVIDEKSQNEPNSRDGVSFVLVDEPSVEDAELITDETANIDISEEPQSVEPEAEATTETVTEAEATAEIVVDDDDDGVIALEADESPDHDAEDAVFKPQYANTQISVVLPKAIEEKRSLLVMDEFPTFGAYSKRSNEVEDVSEDNPELVNVQTQPEPEAKVYGSSAYDSYELSVSEAYLNPRKPALALGDAANFGGYGAGEKDKKKRPATRRPVRKAQPKRLSKKREHELGFGSTVSPIFNAEVKQASESLPTESVEPPKPRFAPNSLVATGGVDGDIKTPLVSIPLSLTLSLGAASTHGIGLSATSHDNGQSTEPAVDAFTQHDEVFGEAFDEAVGFESEQDQTNDHLSSEANEVTDVFGDFDSSSAAHDEESSDLLDQLLSSEAADEPLQDEQAIDFGSVTYDEAESIEVEAEADDDSIDHLLSMAGHDLSHDQPEIQVETSSVTDEFTTEDPLSPASDPFAGEASTFEPDSDLTAPSVDFQDSLGLSDSVDGDQPIFEPEITASNASADDFGPSLSFGEPAEASASPTAPSEAEPMPENVVLHPTSPEYTAPEPVAEVDSVNNSDEGSADPFDPFIRVLWLIETGEVKDARLELEGLLQHTNPDVRRMAYDFKERLNKSEASRA